MLFFIESIAFFMGMTQQLTPTPLKGAAATSPGQRPGGELGANQRPTGAKA